MTIATPLRFEPFLRPMVWGGRALATLGKTLPTAEPYGESWEVSDHALHRSVVAEGPWRGRTLRQLILEERDLLGPAAARFETFPWLIKFLDAADWLSVQVHPDAATAARLRPGEGSKTEAWFVLDAKPGSRIYAGLRPGIGPNELRRAISAGKVVDCLHQFTPSPGDCVFLPAGTVHAVGGGVLFAEIQETSDATFRLHDWDRIDARGQRRELHLDEAFAAIHWDQGPVEPRRGPVAPLDAQHQPPIICEQFVLQPFAATSSVEFPASGRLRALIVTHGEGAWSTGAAVAAGQVWVLPAALESCRLEPRTPLRALLATLP